MPTLDDLVLGDLVPAIEDVANRTGAPVTLIGYCMGGNLALAAALECREAIAQFAALATPWDFSAVEPRHRAAVQHMLATTEPVSRVTGTLSFDALQLLFSQIDPDQVQKKFARFSGLSAGSFAEQLFVAMEDWVNGGADLPADLARGCLTEWYLENRPQRGEWQVNGQPVLPQDLHCRSAVFVPSKDKIVPPTSALALGTSLPNANIFLPRAGHVGMMAGSAAKSKLWEPLVRWLTYKTEGVD
ncbi:MAG: alpha/beta fold hydrolase [Pseudomonadota bacterium]